MDKRTTSIDNNGIIVFNRNFGFEDLKAIPREFCGDIIVHGDLDLCIEETDECKDLISKCTIWCTGDMYCNNINVNGSIYVEGVIHAEDIVCSEDIVCMSEMDFGSLACCGDVFCEGYFYSSKRKVLIKGSFECKHDLEIS